MNISCAYLTSKVVDPKEYAHYIAVAVHILQYHDFDPFPISEEEASGVAYL